jgi:hypothetical protein
VVALKLWFKQVRNKKILLYSDNMATVQVFNSGRAHNQYLQECLREAAFILATNEAELKTVHIAGMDNRVPDYLSRWHINGSFQSLFWREMVKEGKLHVIKEVEVPLSFLLLENNW